MPMFIWEAKTAKNEVKKGELDAPNAEAVYAALRRQGLNPFRVTAKPKEIKLSIPGFSEKVSEKDIVTFTRMFATMIDAGLPLVQCLDILATQTENKTLAKTLFVVKGDVEGGSSFAEALGKHPKHFDTLYVNMIAAGEAGGILDTILARLAGYIEKSMALKKKVKSAMTYPIVVLVISVAVIAMLLVVVIPKFAEMFMGVGGDLPPITQFMMDMSAFAASWRMVAVAGVVASIIIGFKKWRDTEKGRFISDGWFIKMPVIGNLIRKVAVAKFTRTLGTMITSGVPILDALDICARTSGNKIVEAAVQQTRTSISEGKTIAEPLAATGVFPPMVVQMINVGEATGALDAMLNKIADFYDEEVDTAVDALTSMLEPLLMVFLGGAVGFMVIGMYLPIFSMASIGG